MGDHAPFDPRLKSVADELVLGDECRCSMACPLLVVSSKVVTMCGTCGLSGFARLITVLQCFSKTHKGWMGNDCVLHLPDASVQIQIGAQCSQSFGRALREATCLRVSRVLVHGKLLARLSVKLVDTAGSIEVLLESDRPFALGNSLVVAGGSQIAADATYAFRISCHKYRVRARSRAMVWLQRSVHHRRYSCVAQSATKLTMSIGAVFSLP